MITVALLKAEAHAEDVLRTFMIPDEQSEIALAAYRDAVRAVGREEANL